MFLVFQVTAEHVDKVLEFKPFCPPCVTTGLPGQRIYIVRFFAATRLGHHGSNAAERHTVSCHVFMVQFWGCLHHQYASPFVSAIIGWLQGETGPQVCAHFWGVLFDGKGENWILGPQELEFHHSEGHYSHDR